MANLNGTGVHNGLALYRSDIWWMTPSQSLKAARLNIFLLGIFYTIAVGSAKISVLALYWRMFSLGHLRYPIIVLAVCSALWTVIKVGTVELNLVFHRELCSLGNCSVYIDCIWNCALHTSVQVLGPIGGRRVLH
jgi:hypothetical protein